MTQTQVTLLENGATMLLTAVSAYLTTNKNTLPKWSGLLLGGVTIGLNVLNVLEGENGKTALTNHLDRRGLVRRVEHQG